MLKHVPIRQYSAFYQRPSNRVQSIGAAPSRNPRRDFRPGANGNLQIHYERRFSTLDSVRSDYYKIHGYERQTTPFVPLPLCAMSDGILRA
eukprot:8730016-Pyramimonas_sp.AAC.1